MVLGIGYVCVVACFRSSGAAGLSSSVGDGIVEGRWGITVKLRVNR